MTIPIECQYIQKKNLFRHKLGGLSTSKNRVYSKLTGRPIGSSEKSGTNSSYNAGFSVSSHPKGYPGMDANGLKSKPNQENVTKTLQIEVGITEYRL